MNRDDEAAARARRRLNGFLYHLIAYVMAMMVFVVANLLTSDYPWFVLPLVGWGAPLALHAAYAMGLFDVLRR